VSPHASGETTAGAVTAPAASPDQKKERTQLVALREIAPRIALADPVEETGLTRCDGLA
jgi:hypothetical protein